MTKEEVIRKFSSLALAYEGDAVYETYVRSYLLTQTPMPVNRLHQTAKEFVSAKAQSEFMEFIEPILTEQECAVYHRGRNAKSHSHPKNAEIVSYRRATGFEALFGFWHLSGDTAREQEIFDYILSKRKQ